MSITTISYLTDITFGPGAVGQLSDILAHHQISHPLVVTDHGLVGLGITERLGLANATVFADVKTNPDEESVLSGLTVYREKGCDGVVAVGGGSPIDCAKSLALLVTHPQPLEDYALIRGGLTRITANKPPLIAVPTTAGTGSEVGRASLITLASGDKLALISKHMIPDAAVCDPELTLDMPATLTAATGMDAVSHCVETFLSPKINPVADAIALDGLKRAWEHLQPAADNGKNLIHRKEMMMASLQGALSFQKGLGMIHSLSHPLGAITKLRLHHGTLNAIFLPHVIRYNAPACTDKMSCMATAMGIEGGAEEVANAFTRALGELGLPARLSEMNLTSDELVSIPEAAMADHSTPTNPREMTVEDCKQLLNAAL